jgi:mannose-6-phosphate isomerase-like protein (cupin superfamily)
MVQVISEPKVIPSAGNMLKKIEEFVGHVNSNDGAISVARMTSPSGWIEPGQRPDFREITLVLKGELQVETETGILTVLPSQTVITEPGEWVRYSTPGSEGAEYIAICLPAFTPESVHRDE